MNEGKQNENLHKIVLSPTISSLLASSLFVLFLWKQDEWDHAIAAEWIQWYIFNYATDGCVIVWHISERIVKGSLWETQNMLNYESTSWNLSQSIYHEMVTTHWKITGSSIIETIARVNYEVRQ